MEGTTMTLIAGGPKNIVLTPVKHLGGSISLNREASVDSLKINGKLIFRNEIPAHIDKVCPKYWCESALKDK